MLRTHLRLPAETTQAGGPECALLTVLTTAIRTRARALREARDAGLATVEVAIITAVLVGLAVALLATIAVAVRRRQSVRQAEIQ